MAARFVDGLVSVVVVVVVRPTFLGGCFFFRFHLNEVIRLMLVTYVCRLQLGFCFEEGKVGKSSSHTFLD